MSVEVVDPRTLVPMDWPTIVASVARTGRAVVVDPANRTCSAASEIAARSERGEHGDRGASAAVRHGHVRSRGDAVVRRRR
ncbi:transketolase C-terminal domain-containing protein [Solwaraspora sp. WMMA2065]|uniref:transketolase C-terminal domain-containing protein n=1 Tax=Solwaraspora sp. WMMA2065 TaxID=3015166 RepID=UPI00338F6FE6